MAPPRLRRGILLGGGYCCCCSFYCFAAAIVTILFLLWVSKYYLCSLGVVGVGDPANFSFLSRFFSGGESDATASLAYEL